MAKKVMVVDDEKELADEISTMLKNGGYEVVTAYSAKEALGELEKNKVLFGMGGNHIKCIILDIKMPEMDGLQFLKKLREEYKDKVGVIILSAYEDAEKWDKARQGLVAGYISKPVNKEHLLHQLDEFFSGHEEFMIELTRDRTHAKEFADRLRKDFDVEKMRSKIKKELNEKEGKR